MEFQEIVYFKIKDGDKTVLFPFALMSGEKKELLMPWLSGYCSFPKMFKNEIPFFQHWGQGYADSLRAGDSVCGVTITHQTIQDFWEWHDVHKLEHVEWLTKDGEYVYARTEKEAIRLSASLKNPSPTVEKTGYPLEVCQYFHDSTGWFVAKNERHAAQRVKEFKGIIVEPSSITKAK